MQLSAINSLKEIIQGEMYLNNIVVMKRYSGLRTDGMIICFAVYKRAHI